MQLNVLIEPMNGTGFRASSGEPFGIVAEAATREEALKKLQADLQARVNGGAELVTLEVGEDSHPLMKFAGILKDHPLVEEWKKAMADYCDQTEKDDNYP